MTTVRLAQARRAYDDAVRAERLARIAAAPELRRRARRRYASLRLAMIAALVVAVVAAGVGTWAALSASSLNESRAHADDAVTAASDAIVAMLTPDPAQPDAYVRAVTDVSTGDQRQRFDDGRTAIVDYVRSLTVRPAGRIVSAGLIGSGGDDADVLLTAQAGDPTLVGGTPDERRVTLRVRMHFDGRWLVAATERQS